MATADRGVAPVLRPSWIEREESRGKRRKSEVFGIHLPSRQAI